MGSDKKGDGSYYPFGLTMAGISDKALKSQYIENKYRFNGSNELENQEFRDGSGLEVYDAKNRMFDPQLGRFCQIDPLALIYNEWSPYQFANDNPVSYNDPEGADVVPAQPPGPCVACNFPTIDPNGSTVAANVPEKNQLDFGGHNVGQEKVSGLTVNNFFPPSTSYNFEDNSHPDPKLSGIGSYAKYTNYNSESGANNIGPVRGSVSWRSFNFNIMWNRAKAYEAGVSGLTLSVTVQQPFGLPPRYREYLFNTVYVQFPRKTWLGITYSPMEAAVWSAEGFQAAINATANEMEILFGTRAADLRDDAVQKLFMRNAEFFISAGLGMSKAYVTKDFHGLNTVVSPVVWNP